jgi:transposase
MEVILGQARHPWSEDEKRALVAETFFEGKTVHGVARRRNISRSMLFCWRKQYGEALSRTAPASTPISFAPVAVAEPELAAPPASPAPSAAIPLIERVCKRRQAAYFRLRRSRFGSGGDEGAAAAMIPIPSGVRVWIATGHTDMRRGMNGLALQVQQALKRDPHAGDLFVFRGRRGNLVKVLWHDALGMSLYAKRLERGKFIWPSPTDGVVVITPAQLAYMLEGIDWRHPQRTWWPEAAG